MQSAILSIIFVNRIYRLLAQFTPPWIIGLNYIKPRTLLGIKTRMLKILGFSEIANIFSIIAFQEASENRTNLVILESRIAMPNFSRLTH